MKSVVGIDFMGRSDSAIAWLGRLRFPMDETMLVHVTEPLSMTMASGADAANAEAKEIVSGLEKAGACALIHANHVALEHSLRSRAKHCNGISTSALRECAESADASLIAVTATLRNSLGSVFGGGVVRGLAISAKQSVFVAREAMPRERPIRAVFATDQSPYSERCVERLIEFLPRGIARLTLLTVIERNKQERPVSWAEHLGTSSLIETATKSLIHQGERTSEKLTRKGIPTASRVISGEVQETIHGVMGETDADLLIIGAQGHGFSEVLSIGSTSLHQVINERYPVLLLRPAPVLEVTRQAA